MANSALETLKNLIESKQRSDEETANRLASQFETGPRSLFENKGQVVDALLNPPDPFGGSLKFTEKAAAKSPSLLKKAVGLLKKTKAKEAAPVVQKSVGAVDKVVETVIDYISKKGGADLDEGLAIRAVEQLGKELKIPKKTLEFAKDKVLGIVKETNARTLVTELEGKPAELLKRANRVNLKKSERISAGAGADLSNIQIKEALKEARIGKDIADRAETNIRDAIDNIELPPTFTPEELGIDLPLRGRIDNNIANTGKKLRRAKKVSKVITEKAKRKAKPVAKAVGENKLKTAIGGTVGGAALALLMNQFGGSSDAEALSPEDKKRAMDKRVNEILGIEEGPKPQTDIEKELDKLSKRVLEIKGEKL